MNNPVFSIIIPAHNEEKYIGSALRAIRRAAAAVPDCGGEVIVAANRCTDRTIPSARRYGARIVLNQDKCISKIRNAGARAAHGEILVTIDADSLMSPTSLAEIRAMLSTGKYVGGGTRSEFDRISLGILCSGACVAVNLIPIMWKNKAALSGGMFWCYRRDFEKIGGFDESLISLEDMDFAARLNQLGVSRGQKFGTLKKSYILTSSRKFDEFGDWYLIRNWSLTKRIFTGKDREAADGFYYDVR